MSDRLRAYTANVLSRAFNDSLSDITADAGGILRCETCGRTNEVDSRYWSQGWPKCHGYTMRWWTQRQINAGEMPHVGESR